MHVLRGADSTYAFLGLNLNPELNRLIEQRIHELSDFMDVALEDLLCIVVLEESDPASVLDRQLGFSVLSNRFDGIQFGSPDFLPSWDELSTHSEWFELLYVLNDDGFGTVIFIPKILPGVPELLAMCAAYSPDPTALVDL